MTKAKAVEILNRGYDNYLMIEKTCLDAIIKVDDKQVTIRDRLDEITDTKIALLTAIDALEQDNGWISVKDRLPDENTWVLVYSRQGSYINLKVDYIRGGKWFNSMLVTHWMPLPTPPKEG